MGSPESAFRLARLGLCGPFLGGDRCIHGFGGVVALVHPLGRSLGGQPAIGPVHFDARRGSCGVTSLPANQ